MKEVNFGMDGPSITGWWVNPKTGDFFQAIDSFFEDNNLIAKTSTGKFINYNQLQNYVQVSDRTAAENMARNALQKTKQSQKPQKEEIPAEILNELEGAEDKQTESLLIPDDNIYGMSRVTSPERSIEKPVTKKPVGDIDIIQRALQDKGSLKIVGDVKWKNFPLREIQMLIDIMNISENDIIQYYINNISIDDVESMIKDAIKNYIDNSIHAGVNSSSNKNSTKPKKTTKKQE